MKILADFHHSSLYSSYLYTFETRLGHEVYRQIGRDWFEKGFWKINRQEDTIAQYLSPLGYEPSDGTPQLNQIQWVKDGIYYSIDPNTNQIHKAIEFDTFNEMDFDVVIASIPDHIEPFKKLAKMKKAKFIFQAGNMFPPMLWKNVDNFMGSIFPTNIPMHKVFYHQEFDETVFKYVKPTQNKTIYTYMNCLQNFPASYEYWLELQEELPEYTFKEYGAQNKDDSITGIKNLAKSMSEARWIYHYKPGGDGYGHCFFNSLAMGRPMITNKRDYEGKLGGTMIDDHSSIILDGMLPKDLAEMIRNREENNESMGLESRRRFVDCVNFEKESIMLDNFLKELV
jgi:hypothetical protein